MMSDMVGYKPKFATAGKLPTCHVNPVAPQTLNTEARVTQTLHFNTLTLLTPLTVIHRCSCTDVNTACELQQLTLHRPLSNTTTVQSEPPRWTQNNFEDFSAAAKLLCEVQVRDTDLCLTIKTWNEFKLNLTNHPSTPLSILVVPNLGMS